MENMQIRGVEIEGIELLHPNIIPILDYLLEHEPETKLERIIIKAEGGPKGFFGKYYPELALCVINLEHLFNFAVKQTKDTTAEMLSLPAIIWMNLIWTLGHEIHHAVAFATDSDGLLEDPEYMKREDEEADDYGDECVKTIARLNLYIEPPALGDMPFFGLKTWQMVTEAVQAEEDWGKTQQEMFSKGYAYSAVNFDLASLREYVRMCNGNPDWEEATSKVEVVQPKAMVAGVTAEPTPAVAAPTTLAEAVRPVAEAPAVAQPVVQEVVDIPAQMDYEGNLNDVMGDLDDILDDGSAHVDHECPECGVNADDVPYGEQYTGEEHTAGTGAVMQPSGAVMQPVAHPTFAPTATQETMIANPLIQATHEVYKAVIAHLFTNVWDSRGMWKDGNALWTPVDITGIPSAREIVLAYATNQKGMRQELPADGQIVGRTFKNHTIPGYDIIMSINGQGFKRRLIVQNPFKTSKYANQAQAGHQIVWIIDIATNAWIGHYFDGIWHPNSS